MRPEQMDLDLDEVDIAILDVVAYVRQYVCDAGQVGEFMRERLAVILELIDADDSCPADSAASIN